VKYAEANQGIEIVCAGRLRSHGTLRAAQKNSTAKIQDGDDACKKSDERVDELFSCLPCGSSRLEGTVHATGSERPLGPLAAHASAEATVATRNKRSRSTDTSIGSSRNKATTPYERTLMAWVRTATSLITFGFTIYKFFQIELASDASKSVHLIGPREFALAMIVIGLVSLVMATLEHRRELQALSAQYPGVAPRSLARVLAALISFLGIIALIAVVFRQ
jgi:putative membrane protein